MAVTAGIIEADLRENLAAIFGELFNLVRVDAHHVGAHVTGEDLGVPCGRFDEQWHMAPATIRRSGMDQRILVLCLCRVAIPTLGVCVGDIILHGQLHDTLMWIMADHTVNQNVFARNQIFCLVVILDKTITDLDGLKITSLMALGAHFCIPIDNHLNSLWILDV